VDIVARQVDGIVVVESVHVGLYTT
jgi:hypothetical protein